MLRARTMQSPLRRLHDCVVLGLCVTLSGAFAPASRELCFARQHHDDSRHLDRKRKPSNSYTLACTRFQVFKKYMGEILIYTFVNIYGKILIYITILILLLSLLFGGPQIQFSPWAFKFSRPALIEKG